jgi:pimeloyl-ACP methyl ester carboxylesterase
LAISQQYPLGDEGLSAIPELTTEAVEAARWNPAVGCLVDRVYPGHPLILSFGYRQEQYLPAFDFFGRTKKLENLIATRFNRILVRDVFNGWYHRGVPGMGADINEVSATLRGLIDAMAPCRVHAIGQSMGGYAAIMFGMLLGADRITAFAPLSHLDAEEAIRYGDLGFLSVMERLRQDRPRVAYLDLVGLGRSVGFRGELQVVFGTHPRQDDGVSSNFDALHALRLARLPNVSLYPYPEADHGIVQWLVENKRMDDLLIRLLGERASSARS